MVNITLAIDDKILKSARAYAKARGTTLNALVRGQLTLLVEQEQRQENARKRLVELARKSTAELGKKRLAESGLAVTTAGDMADGAKKIVALAAGKAGN